MRFFLKSINAERFIPRENRAGTSRSCWARRFLIPLRPHIYSERNYCLKLTIGEQVRSIVQVQSRGINIDMYINRQREALKTYENNNGRKYTKHQVDLSS